MEYRVSEYGVGSIFGPEEAEAAAQALQQDTLSYGPQMEKFEEEFAEYVGVKNVLSVGSCSAALLLATKVLRLNKEDEVISTPQSFRATIMPLWARGVTIRFADIDPNSLNIDPGTIEDKITDKTKAIYLVHYGGQPAEMEPIMEIARRHNLYVVEDAAHAPGAVYKGKKIGCHADLICYSFHSLKNMSLGGQGGMLVVNRDELYAPLVDLRTIRSYSKREKKNKVGIGPYKPDPNLNDDAKGAWDERLTEIYSFGNNYRIDEVQAAIGRVQLSKLDSFNDKRREIAHYLDEHLSQIEGITVQKVPEYIRHVYHLYTFFYDETIVGAPRTEFIKILAKDKKIEINQRFFPLHLFLESQYFGHKLGECPVTEKVFFEKQVGLPMNPRLSREDCDYMIEAVSDAIKQLKKGK